MLAAGFLAFWLQGLDTAGRSSVGKNKLIRPGVWQCFESVLAPWAHKLSLCTGQRSCPGVGPGSPGQFAAGRGTNWVVLL